MSVDLLDRLGRRGVLTITVEDGNYDVRFKAPGPYRGRSWCTTDEADLYEHCHLGAKNWFGEGSDLAALLAECEEATRPRPRDVDELVFAVEWRRDTRTLGPPLPSYGGSYRGWRHGEGRWLRCSGHAYEYLGGYLRYLKMERTDKVERLQSEMRRKAAERRRVKEVLA